MLFARKIIGREILWDKKAYHASLLEFGGHSFHRFVLCLRAIKSNIVRVIYLEELEEQKEHVIKNFFPQRKGVGREFPKPEDERWRPATYRIIDVVRRSPSENWALISKAHSFINRASGRRLSRVPWYRIRKIKEGGDIGISEKGPLVGV